MYHPALLHLAPYAALLTFIYIVMSFRIARLRIHHRLSIGVAEDDTMQRAVRAQANFGEYVPLALLLLTMCCLLHAAPLFIDIQGIVLVLARLTHIYSITVFEPKRRRHVLRPYAMVGTQFVLFSAAAFLLWQWLRFVL